MALTRPGSACRCVAAFGCRHLGTGWGRYTGGATEVFPTCVAAAFGCKTLGGDCGRYAGGAADLTSSCWIGGRLTVLWAEAGGDCGRFGLFMSVAFEMRPDSGREAGQSVRRREIRPDTGESTPTSGGSQ